MKSRGQEDFVRLPGFAARLYDRLIRSKAIDREYLEIAQDLASTIDLGRVLDVGTGPGWMLLKLYQLNSHIQLYGLDISEAMVQLARKNLAGIPADLRQGNIEHTDYEDGFFDIVTCAGSFYLWDRPEQCLDEIHRILKPGQTAYLYETYQDYDADELREALRENLKQEGLLRKLITPHFLKRQLKMTYVIKEMEAIIQRSRFNQNHALEKIRLGGLPIWLRIRLNKSA